MHQSKSVNRWLDAQCDGTAALHTLPSCISLCDLKNDNYYQLVIADVPLLDFEIKPKLKVYKGTNLTSEQVLPGIPSAVESFYINDVEPKIPIIAVATGCSILFFRNMKPYYKYTLPSMDVQPLEKEVWNKLPIERPENIDKHLDNLRTIEISQLTFLSQHLLHLPVDERPAFIQQSADIKLERLSIVTAMTSIRKASAELKSTSCLIIASESGDIFILDTQAFVILHQAKACSFKGTPSLVSATGQYDVDFKLIIATREGSLCLLRKGWLEGQQIVRLENPATGLAVLPIEQTIVVVCMDNLLACYSKKGKKLWSVTLPHPAICLTPVDLPHLGINLVCVALRGGLVQFYAQKKMVDQFYAPETVSAMKFGRLGQEEHVLILVTVDGSLIVKILKRTAEFSITENIYDTKSTRNQDTSTSLQIPKKTKIFVEQTIRERENAPAIHNSFQYEIWRMRLTAARATVDVINSADSTISGDIGQAPIKLAAEVLGLGPVFKLFIVLENMAARKEASNLNILLHADHRHYVTERPFLKLPPLVPGAPLKLDFKITVVTDPNDGLPPCDLTPENSIIRVMIFKSGQAKPLIASTVVMPQPEPQILNTF